jgi:hypothetical protein
MESKIFQLVLVHDIFNVLSQCTFLRSIKCATAWMFLILQYIKCVSVVCDLVSQVLPISNTLKWQDFEWGYFEFNIQQCACNFPANKLFLIFPGKPVCEMFKPNEFQSVIEIQLFYKIILVLLKIKMSTCMYLYLWLVSRVNSMVSQVWLRWERRSRVGWPRGSLYGAGILENWNQSARQYTVSYCSFCYGRNPYLRNRRADNSITNIPPAVSTVCGDRW